MTRYTSYNYIDATRQTSARFALFTSAAAALIAYAPMAHAAGTLAGTDITNTAKASYDTLNGTVSFDSNTVVVKVDELLDVIIPALCLLEAAAAFARAENRNGVGVRGFRLGKNGDIQSAVRRSRVGVWGFRLGENGDIQSDGWPRWKNLNGWWGGRGGNGTRRLHGAKGDGCEGEKLGSKVHYRIINSCELLIYLKIVLFEIRRVINHNL